MKDSDISILIPTLSRPEFLLKNLNFLVKLNANFNICICDSSPNIKKDFINKLNIRTTRYAAIDSKSDIEHLGDFLPGILKTTTLGYDGNGQYPINKIEEI